MIDRGFTTKTIEEMAEVAKNDPDFEFDNWNYNSKAKVLNLLKGEKLIAGIMIKESEEGFTAKSVW